MSLTGHWSVRVAGGKNLPNVKKPLKAFGGELFCL